MVKHRALIALFPILVVSIVSILNRFKMAAPKPTIAVLGGTGHTGQHIMNALISSTFRSSYSQVILLTRQDAINSKVAELEKAGAVIRTYTEFTLLNSLHDVDILVCALNTSGHHTKDALLEILSKTNISLYIPSEFGVDHSIHDFKHPLWDSKKAHSTGAQKAKREMKVCRVYSGLFLEDSLTVPYLGLQTSSGKFEAIGSADQKISFTSIVDNGKVIASLGTLPIDEVPDEVRVASDTISPKAVAELWNAKKDKKIAVSEVDLKAFKETSLNAETVSAAACLRLLQGEGKIDHGAAGLGNHNELVNPGESKWKWTKVAEWVDTV